MNKTISALLSIVLLLCFSSSVSAMISDESMSKKFPNRKFYPGLNYISTKQMVNDVKAGKYLIIDARPALGYQTLRIKDAVNIHSGDKQFVEKLMTAVNENNKPIVFYCGGLTCLKSYKASVKAIEELRKKKINRDVFTYDSGISAFAYASPELVLKNGEEVSAENPILNVKKLKKHAKSAEDFTALINNDEDGQFVILDVRENKQQILRKLFMFKKEKKITVLEPDKLIEFLNEVKASNKTLMVYGAVEKQIESIFQLIKAAGNKKWFYLEGGEYAYSQYMIKKHVAN